LDVEVSMKVFKITKVIKSSDILLKNNNNDARSSVSLVLLD